MLHPWMRFTSPRLMFNGTGDGATGGGEATPKNEFDGEVFDFPIETAVSDMTPEQKAEYWRRQSKVQQKLADGRKDFDKYKTDSEELARVKNENASQAEKDLAKADEDGFARGKNHFLTPAVVSALRAETGRTKEDVEAAIAFVDVSKFLDDNGDLSNEKLTTFATTLGSSAGEGIPPIDPVRDALERQSRGDQQHRGGSVADLEQQEYERLTKKKPQS
ncbi:hypothetical protein MN032_11095 [Agromyces atrinae]|uniref:hypothetical protein n=1 Tax=Agromyces atrinae TaxID=592376 RepID=UPI001F59EDCD|nr:hypothetical protein [Agromyces atrinae]MCI2958244.1 hypothetical protein [Agromyces atrinae]